MGVFRADNEDELRKHVENAFAAIAESAILATNPGVSVCISSDLLAAQLFAFENKHVFKEYRCHVLSSPAMSSPRSSSQPLAHCLVSCLR